MLCAIFFLFKPFRLVKILWKDFCWRYCTVENSISFWKQKNVTGTGFEPVTWRFMLQRSTNWANLATGEFRFCHTFLFQDFLSTVVACYPCHLWKHYVLNTRRAHHMLNAIRHWILPFKSFGLVEFTWKYFCFGKLYCRNMISFWNRKMCPMLDSNQRPSHSRGNALTNWANGTTDWIVHKDNFSVSSPKGLNGKI